MLSSVDDKHIERRKYSVREFIKEFPHQEMISWWFKSLAGKIDKCGCVEHLAGSGRPMTMVNA